MRGFFGRSIHAPDAGPPATRPLFGLGRIVSTRGALDALQALYGPLAFPAISGLVARHVRGDWGDVGGSDRAANRRTLCDGSRIFSAYMLANGDTTVWVITEAEGDDAQRASTCVLLPEDY